MFRFENPEYLYFLVAIPLLALLHYWTDYRKRRRLVRFGDPGLLKGLMKDVSHWRPEVKTWCMLLALACVIVAAARPQFGTKVDTTERYGIEAIIAMDVSNSMLANDVRPSRLDKAKMLFSNMIDGMRNDMVGVVAFAGDAFVQLPITNDYVSAKMFLDLMNPSLIRVQGTDIGDAINLSMKCFTQKKDVSRAIFLITDGEDHEGGAEEAAKAAAKKGIHLYVLGVGTPEGAHVPIQGTSQYIIDEQGEPVVSRLNEDMCRKIAQVGKGAYIYVNNSSSAQDELAKYVDKLGKAQMESTVYSEYDEQFQGFLLIALILLVLDVLLLERENHIFKSLRLFKRASVVIVLLTASLALQAQSYRDYIRRGNRLFRDSIYDKAQVEYQKGYQKDSTNVQVLYNLANSYLWQDKAEEPMRLLEKAGQAERNPARRAKIFHNMGVILQGQQQFKQAIECYKEALRCNPSDDETRYNMVLCQRQLKDGDNQDNQDNQDGDDNQDKKDDQNQKDQQDQQDKDNDDQQQQQQEQQQQNEMDRDNVEQMLKAAIQKEQQTQEKLKQQEQQPQSRRLQKQW